MGNFLACTKVRAHCCPVVLVVAAVGWWATSASAQPAANAVGPAIQANTYTTSTQRDPVVATDGLGNFVVVWESRGQDDGVTFNSWGVFGQRFDRSGNPLGSEFQVNTFTDGNQDDPAIAQSSLGGFVVAWVSDGQDGYGHGVFGQRFDWTGVPQGGEFQVNTFTSSAQLGQSIAMNRSTGDFVVVWSSRDGQDGEADGIFGQRFDASGSPQGVEFQANTYTFGDQYDPDVAMSSSGAFVVVWTSRDGQDGQGEGVFGQRFDASGSPAGMEFLVNDYTNYYQHSAVVGADDSGEFVVAWQGVNQIEPGVFTFDIFAQRFDAGGAEKEPEFLVNTITNFQYDPFLTMAGGGEFVVAWERESAGSSATYGQVFDASGAAVGGVFPVHPRDGGEIAYDPAGNFVVVYDYPGDGDSAGIFVQRFLGPCAESLALTQDQWQLIGLPCDPPDSADTVQDVLADDLDGVYGTDWAVVAWDAPNDDYVTLGLGTPLEVGVGYWIKTLLADQSITVEGTNADYSVGASSTLGPAGGGHLSPELVEAVGDCQDADLSDGRFNLLGFPFHPTAGLAGALVREDTGSGVIEHTFPEAEAVDLVSNRIWTWGGSAYQARDTCTPGMEAELSKWDGFWVDVCDTASTLEVLLPTRNLNLACDPPPDPGSEGETGGGRDGATGSEPGSHRPGHDSAGFEALRGGGKPPKDESWYLRIVASADGLTDPGNVLGELPDSVLGYDSHDLVELPPFGTDWLTIVFPHTDWGEESSDWYTSDYHGLRDPREWSFEVRSSVPRTVTLTWEFTGDAKLVEKLGRHMELVDLVTGERVPAAAGSYSFTMNGPEHPFAWLGRRGGGPRW